MNIGQTTPPEAQEFLQQGYRYIDVRTEMEFANGHPHGAVNIPVAIVNPQTQQMMLNPDFVRVVEAHFPKDQALILGCQAGSRSQRAADMLAASGYSTVLNMQGGWGGGMNPMTGAGVAGWAACGLPVCSQCGPNDSYAALSAVAA